MNCRFILHFKKFRIDAIKSTDDYRSSMILEAKRKAAEEEPEPEPEPSKAKAQTKLHEEFINEIKTDEKIINEQIFKKYFFIILHYF